MPRAERNGAWLPRIREESGEQPVVSVTVALVTLPGHHHHHHHHHRLIYSAPIATRPQVRHTTVKRTRANKSQQILKAALKWCDFNSFRKLGRICHCANVVMKCVPGRWILQSDLMTKASFVAAQDSDPYISTGRTGNWTTRGYANSRTGQLAVSQMSPKEQQELIRRWDSERELLRSAPGSYPNSLK